MFTRIHTYTHTCTHTQLHSMLILSYICPVTLSHLCVHTLKTDPTYTCTQVNTFLIHAVGVCIHMRAVCIAPHEVHTHAPVNTSHGAERLIGRHCPCVDSPQPCCSSIAVKGEPHRPPRDRLQNLWSWWGFLGTSYKRRPQTSQYLPRSHVGIRHGADILSSTPGPVCSSSVCPFTHSFLLSLISHPIAA